MSTPFRVRLASCGLALAAAGACTDAENDPARVSYDGLDLPTGYYGPTQVQVAVVADLTGPGALAGRAFADALRAGFAKDSLSDIEYGQQPTFAVHVLDDRGREEGIRGAARQLEGDPAVHVAIVAPGAGRARAAGELAPHTVVVCAGCARDEATREGAFALEGEEGAATAAAAWIRSAMRGEHGWNSRSLAIGLRATAPPSGHALFEGSAPAVDPDQFRARTAAPKR